MGASQTHFFANTWLYHYKHTVSFIPSIIYKATLVLLNSGLPTEANGCTSSSAPSQPFSINLQLQHHDQQGTASRRLKGHCFVYMTFIIWNFNRMNPTAALGPSRTSLFVILFASWNSGRHCKKRITLVEIMNGWMNGWMGENDTGLKVLERKMQRPQGQVLFEYQHGQI